MGYLSKIETIVNDSISAYGHTKIVMRGLPYFVDPLLRGDVRFSKRTGNNISFLNPDNQYLLEESIPTKTSVVPLRYPSFWISPGSLMSFGPNKEFAEISDVSSDGKKLILTTPLRLAFAADESILLYASPLKIHSSALAETTSVEVKSHWFLANGDTFCYLQSPGLFQSAGEIKIDKAEYLGISSDPYYTKVYRLHLSKPVTVELKGGETAYIRAFPAYQSQAVRIPNVVSSSDEMGPFLLDYLSGRLTEGQSFKETFSLKAFSNYGDYVYGDNVSFEKIGKNFSIIERPWANAYPLFWEIAEGSMSYTPSRVVFKARPLELSYRFKNDQTPRVGFSYEGSTGVVTYSGPVDLGDAATGDIFLDCAGNKFTVSSVNREGSNPTIQIVEIGTLDYVFAPVVVSAGSSVITMEEVPPEIRVGWSVVGSQVPNGTLVTGIASTAVTISNNAFAGGDSVFMFRSPQIFPAEGNVNQADPIADTDGAIITDNSSELRKFCVATRCVPPLPENRSFRSSIRSNTDVSVRFIFHPNPPQEFNLIGGLNTPIELNLGSLPVTSIEINMTGFSDLTELTMTDWTPLNTPVDQVQYTIVVDAVGVSSYQSSGLIIKPLFHGVEYLKSNFDSANKYDSGKIYF